MEYLGDSLLDMAIAEYFFKQNPNYTAGELTMKKHATVNNNFLSLASISHNFDQFILIHNRDYFLKQIAELKINL